jgi:hypothetical protein
MEQDARMVELAAVNRRLNTVTAYLKTKQTRESMDGDMKRARVGLNDHTAMFVHLDGVIIQGRWYFCFWRFPI